jgi:riboflavin kinase/FMN adenylyltransferase
MRVFRDFVGVESITNAVVTTGSFDGVHIGHKTILNRLKRLADQEKGESVLITFDPHPRKVLYPETAGKDLRLINSHEEKLELLNESGLDNVIIVKFTREFSKIKSEEFVTEFLCKKLKAKTIVVGFNHHFGFNQEGDYRQLLALHDKYNFMVEEIPEQEVEHESVSSTRIRQALKEGYIQRANAYLDHYYLIMGEAEPFSFPDSTSSLPFFRIKINDPCKLIPPPGIYAVSVRSCSGISKGMVIIWQNEAGYCSVLLHLIDSDKFSQSRVKLYFHKKVHGQVSLTGNKSAKRIFEARNEIAELIY